MVAVDSSSKSLVALTAESDGTYWLERTDAKLNGRTLLCRPRDLQMISRQLEVVRYSSSGSNDYALYHRVFRKNNNRNSTLVILFHGGPLGLATRGYPSAATRLLSQAGLDMLEPEYSGSGQFRVGPPDPKISAGSIADDIHRIERWARKRGYKKIISVGVSLGGVYASEMAREFPAAVEQIILIAPFSSYKPGLDIVGKPLKPYSVQYEMERLSFGTDKQRMDFGLWMRRLYESQCRNPKLFAIVGELDDVVGGGNIEPCLAARILKIGGYNHDGVSQSQVAWQNILGRIK